MTAKFKPENQPNTLPPTSRSLPIALMRARENVMGPIREMLQQSGITEQQWRILRVLNDQGPMDSTQLSKNACLLLPSLTRITQTMLEKGLVDRNPDPNDRRRQTISITDSGSEIIEENLEQAQQIAANFVNTLGNEKYERLLDLLGELEQLNS